MAHPLKPIRRVVTGNDADGKSGVLWDSAAPNANPGPIRPGTGASTSTRNGDTRRVRQAKARGWPDESYQFGSV